MYQNQEEGQLPDFKTAILYSEMYGKVMGLESGFTISKVTTMFKGSGVKDEAIVEMNVDPRKHVIWFRNYGYLISPC